MRVEFNYADDKSAVTIKKTLASKKDMEALVDELRSYGEVLWPSKDRPAMPARDPRTGHFLKAKPVLVREEEKAA